MKLKFTYVIVNFILILSLVLGITKINRLKYQAGSVVEVNERRMQAETGLQKNADRSQLEHQLNCRILYVTDHEYTDFLYREMEAGNLIFDYIKDSHLVAKICFSSDVDSISGLKHSMTKIFLAVILFLFVTFQMVWFYYEYRILRPFHKLKKFASDIAKGNFDAPLERNKDNYFGAFTQSFDLMREELKAAKEGEIEANRSKKELVASLSHDIKTPVATIHALCEILELKLTDQDNYEKIVIIHRKADMIDALISNMFHATLEELKALKIEPSEQPSTILFECFEETNRNGQLHYMNQLPECLIYADALRTSQVIDNIISNSYKYANTTIDISFDETPEYILVKICDHGPGIDNIELPLVTEKFFRGSNSDGKNGSGLGLYLAMRFMQGMEGSMECENDQGFCVILSFLKIGIKKQLRNL